MKNNDDIKKLLEAFDRTEQWRGEDPTPPNGKLVGEEAGGFLGGHFDSDKQVREEEGVAGAEKNKELAHAKIDLIQGREGEQRHVWQRHYDRAIRNGKDKAQARRYADSMTGSEAVFNGDDNEITNEREAGAGYGDATQRGTPPWMMPGSDGGDGNDGKKTSFQLAGDDEEENVFVDEGDEAVGLGHADIGDPAPVSAPPPVAAPAGKFTVEYQGRDVGRTFNTAKNVMDFIAMRAAQGKPANQHTINGKPFNPQVAPVPADTALPGSQPLAPADSPFESKDYNDVTMLEAKLMKAYEDYVGDPYSENNVIPKKANKRPGKDVPKAKKAKRQPEPNKLAEGKTEKVVKGKVTAVLNSINKKEQGSGNKLLAYTKEQGKWMLHFLNYERPDGGTVKYQIYSNKDNKVNISCVSSPKKKEKPFRDAAATGNPRDFANESNADDERDERRDAREPVSQNWVDPLDNAIEIKSKNGSVVGIVYQTREGNWAEEYHNGVGHDGYGSKEEAIDGLRSTHKEHMELRSNRKKPVAEAGKKKSENRELWDRIKARGTTRGVDKERYTDMSGEGLEGPFPQKNGQVLYYDPKEGKYYNRDTDMYVDQADYDAMNEGDPAIPAEVHDRNKAKDREAFQRNFARGAGERTKRAVDAGVQQFMKRPVKSDPAAVGESSGRFAQLAHLRAKFESVSSKLKELKGQKALKEAPIDQTVAPVVPGQQPQQQQGAAPATTVAPTPGAAANPATAGATQPAVPAKPAAPGTPVSAQAAVPNMVAGIKQSMQPAAFNQFKQAVVKS